MLKLNPQSKLIAYICGAVLGFILVLIGCVIVYQRTTAIKITEIKYNTNVTFTTPDIIRNSIASTANVKRNYFDFNTESVVTSLGSNSFIKYALVSKVWPNKVKVIIAEYEPYARWTNGIEQGYITEDGKLIFAPQQKLVNRKELLDYVIANNHESASILTRALEQQHTQAQKANEQQISRLEKLKKTRLTNSRQFAAESVEISKLVAQQVQELTENTSTEVVATAESSQEVGNKDSQDIAKDSTEMASDGNQTASQLLSSQPFLTLDLVDVFSELPLFISNRQDIALAIDYWKQIRDIFATEHLKIKQIRINSPDTWDILLSNNVTLYLDSIDIRGSILKYTLAMKEIVVPKNYLIGYVDLRYKNGLAIKFIKQDDLAKNPTLLRRTLIPNADVSNQNNPIFTPIITTMIPKY